MASYYKTRVLFTRSLAFVYLIAFLVAYSQNVALMGSHGLTPACHAFQHSASSHTHTHTHTGSAEVVCGSITSCINAYMRSPSIYTFICNDAALLGVPAVGALISLFVLLHGAANVCAWVCVYALYLSIVVLADGARVPWYSFGWEAQLLETGFWAILIAPLLDMRRTAPTPPSFAGVCVYRLLVAKIMLGAGLIKLRGDECWRDLSCMQYHYETQPNPHPVAWYLHALPGWFHAIGVCVNHGVELLAPVMLLLPRAWRILGGAAVAGFMLTIAASGNLSFLNHLTILPCIWVLDDDAINTIHAYAGGASRLMCCGGKAITSVENTAHGSEATPATSASEPIEPTGKHAPGSNASRTWRMRYLTARDMLLTWPALFFVLFMNAPVFSNILSPHQVMNTSFSVWRICNTYGAFGSVGRTRPEIIISGVTDAHALAAMPPPGRNDPRWVEFQFVCKPGALSKAPCLITPFHLRLDWLMWFAAMGSYQQYPWTVSLAHALLTSRVRHGGGTSLLTGAEDVYGLLCEQQLALNATISYIRIDKFEYRFTPPGLSRAAASLLQDAGADSKSHEISPERLQELCELIPTTWRWTRRRKLVEKASKTKLPSCIGVKGRIAAHAGDGAYVQLLLSTGDAIDVGTWWTRRFLEEYLPSLDAENSSLQQFMRAQGYLPVLNAKATEALHGGAALT